MMPAAKDSDHDRDARSAIDAAASGNAAALRQLLALLRAFPLLELSAPDIGDGGKRITELVECWQHGGHEWREVARAETLRPLYALLYGMSHFELAALGISISFMLLQ